MSDRPRIKADTQHLDELVDRARRGRVRIPTCSIRREAQILADHRSSRDADRTLGRWVPLACLALSTPTQPAASRGREMAVNGQAAVDREPQALSVERVRLRVHTVGDLSGDGELAATVMASGGSAAIHLAYTDFGATTGSQALQLPDGETWMYLPAYKRANLLTSTQHIAGAVVTSAELPAVAALVTHLRSDDVGSEVSRAWRGPDHRLQFVPTDPDDRLEETLELWAGGALTTTLRVAWNAATPPEVAAVEVTHPGSLSRTTFTVLERQVPGPLPACAEALDLCSKLDGFLDGARVTPASFRHPEPPPAEVLREPRDCDLFDSDVIIVSERSHEELAPKWGTAYLLDLARACDTHVDCLFVERAASVDWSAPTHRSDGPPLDATLRNAAKRTGARIVGVDVDDAVATDLAARRRTATPAARYRAERELIVDRNAFMAQEMIRSDCTNGVMMVGGGHVSYPPFDPALSVPGILAAAGWSVSVLDAACVAPAPDLGWRGADPIVRLVRTPNDGLPADRFASGLLQAECQVRR